MKKLLLILFSILISFNSIAEWVYIDKEKNSDTEVYVLNDSIEIEDGYVYWTYLNNYSKPRSEYNIMGLAIFRGGDCENNRYVNIESQMFQGSMGSEPFGERLKQEQEWTTPSSGQIDEKIFNYVCDYAGLGQVEVEKENKHATYNCEPVKGSAFFGISKATKEPFNYGIGGFKTNFTLNADRTTVWMGLGSTAYEGVFFDLLDYVDDNNFSASRKQTAYDTHSSLFLKDGYLFMNWMSRDYDNPQISVQISKCSLME